MGTPEISRMRVQILQGNTFTAPQQFELLLLVEKLSKRVDALEERLNRITPR